jgi:hypothetical protein
MIATSAGAPRQGARPRGRLPLPRRLANRDARAFNAVPVGRAYGHRQAGCAVPEREHTADQHRPKCSMARGDAIPRIFEVLSVRRRRGARAYTPTCHEIGGAKAIAEVRTRVGPVRLAKHVAALVATGSKRDQLGSPVKVAVGDGAEIHLLPKESGAGGGGRTHTTLRSRDFKSRASASFATPAQSSV